jgi:hypothetical protein
VELINGSFDDKSVAILIVGYLGVPETVGFVACDVDQRYTYTKEGFMSL